MMAGDLMETFDGPMSAEQFDEALKFLGLSVYASAPVLAISLRQAQRYSSGEQIVAGPTARYLRVLQYHVTGLKLDREKLQKRIAILASGRGLIYENKVDVTAKTIAELNRQLGVIEGLLLKHPSGLKNLI
jgi:hypothetical protein